MRLCKDNKWRSFASFGTFKECVKVYKQRNRAINFAKHQTAILEYNGLPHKVEVAEITNDKFVVDACGNVFNDENFKVGTLNDFVISR